MSETDFLDNDFLGQTPEHHFRARLLEMMDKQQHMPKDQYRSLPVLKVAGPTEHYYGGVSLDENVMQPVLKRDRNCLFVYLEGGRIFRIDIQEVT